MTEFWLNIYAVPAVPSLNMPASTSADFPCETREQCELSARRTVWRRPALRLHVKLKPGWSFNTERSGGRLVGRLERVL